MAILRMTRKEYEERYGVSAPNTSSVTMPREQSSSSPAVSTQGQRGSFLSGLTKSGKSTIKGLAELGEGVGKFLTPKSMEGAFDINPEEDFGGAFSTEELKTLPGEGVGRFVGDVAQYAIPSAKIAKITKGASGLVKTAGQALAGGGVAAAQSGEVGKEVATVAGITAALPIVGRVSKPVLSGIARIFKGFGSAASGASASQLSAAKQGWKAAGQTAKELRAGGVGAAAGIRERNARTILGGLQQIGREASSRFGNRLEKIIKIRVPTQWIKNNVDEAWTKNKVEFSKTGGIGFDATDFIDDAASLKRAREIATQLNNLKNPDGRTLRNLLDFIERREWTSTGGSGSKAALNKFARDTSAAVRKSLVSADKTGLLARANAEYAADKQLTELIGDNFKDFTFGSLDEVGAVARKLDTLFNKGVFDEKMINDFFKRIGVDAAAFRGSEASLQMGGILERMNSLGTNRYELIRAATGSIVTPKLVRRIAIIAGWADDVAKEFLTKLSPATRGILLRSIVGENEPNETK